MTASVGAEAPGPALEQPSLELAALDAAAGAWTVLSAAYGRPPDASFLAAIRSPEHLSAWPYRDPDSMAGQSLLLASGTKGETLEQIRAEHQRLLLGPERLPVPPWESVHRSVEGLVFERETLQVRAAYRRFGLRAERMGTEPDDHVAIECAFLAHLCVAALDAVDAGRDASHYIDGYREFVREHAARWLPIFFAGMAEHADTRFGRGLALLGHGAVAAAAASVGIPKDPAFERVTDRVAHNDGCDGGA